MIRSSVSRLSRRVIATSSKNHRSNRLSKQQQHRSMSGNPLEADTGNLGTHIHHKLSQSLAVIAPVYFLTPDSTFDGFFGKAFGVLLAGNVSAHSWIGLNHVATDYVPKVSKALLGPSRIVIAGMTGVTFLGLSLVSVSSNGGIKGCLKGLWNPTTEERKK